MKKRIILLLLLSLTLVISCVGNNTVKNGNWPLEIDGDLEINKLTDSVYLIKHSFPWGANSLLVVTGNKSALLIDTPYTPRATEQVVKWGMEELSIKEFAAINTHFHIDNCGGNSFLIDQGFPVYSSGLTQKLLKEKGEASLAMTIEWLQSDDKDRFRAELETLNLVSADNIFTLPKSGNSIPLKFKNESVQVYYPGPGHTEDNIAVYIPSAKVLFGGCLIKSANSKNLGNLSDGFPDLYLDSVENILSDFDNIENLQVIPGHGESGGIELVSHTRQLCSELE